MDLSWVSSRSWWWTGRPGVLQFMGSQRVGHDWATEMNWTELNLLSHLIYLFLFHVHDCFNIVYSNLCLLWERFLLLNFFFFFKFCQSIFHILLFHLIFFCIADGFLYSSCTRFSTILFSTNSCLSRTSVFNLRWKDLYDVVKFEIILDSDGPYKHNGCP